LSIVSSLDLCLNQDVINEIWSVFDNSIEPTWLSTDVDNSANALMNIFISATKNESNSVENLRSRSKMFCIIAESKHILPDLWKELCQILVDLLSSNETIDSTLVDALLSMLLERTNDCK
jgi:hypothetical protein